MARLASGWGGGVCVAWDEPPRLAGTAGQGRQAELSLRPSRIWAGMMMDASCIMRGIYVCMYVCMHARYRQGVQV